jgi:hypothetical protein
MIRSVTRAAAALFVAALVAGACGGSGSSQPSADAPAGTDGTTPATAASGAPVVSTQIDGKDIASDAACNFVTQADATKLFGHHAESKPDPATSSLAKSVCLWGANADKGQEDDEIFLVQVRIYPNENFYGQRLFPDAKLLTGLGDKAFIHATGLGGQEVQFVRDGDTYAISYSVVAFGKNKPKPDEVASQLEALVRSAAAKG